MKDFIIKKTRLMHVSPWLLAAAIGLLTLIIVAQAANNFQREKRLLAESLFRKGQSISSFVEASMRASMVSGMMSRMMGLSATDPSIYQTQHLLEQAAKDPDILYITVIDGAGTIVTSSDPDGMGRKISRDINLYRDAGSTGKYHIVTQDGRSPRKVFEVVSDFLPFADQGGTLLRRWRNRFLQQNPLPPHGELKFAHPPTVHDEIHGVPTTMYILVGLDMTELELAVRQYGIQIASISLVLLLVGLGGWLSLIAIQSYNISQKALTRIQAFTGMLISNLPVGIIATDQASTIQTFNQAAGHMLDLEHNRVVGKLPTDVLPAEIAPFFDNQGGDEVLREGETSFTGKNGQRLTLHLNALPVYNQASRSIMGRVLLMYDLSDIKRLEKEMQRHDRLVALGKMAAGVAHEVRNPLSSIKGFATLLGRKFEKDTEEQKAAQLLVQEAERLNRSITELLNYARPTPLNRQPVALEEFIENTVQLVSSDSAALGISLEIACDPELPPVSADPDRLNQVLLNLYLNGLQAMEKEGGTLRVEAHRAQDPAYVEISVTDTGCGIPEEFLERILDPYFTTKPGGTGLGLAMAYKIIDEHGGTIRFTSGEGEGTTVFVVLPIVA